MMAGEWGDGDGGHIIARTRDSCERAIGREGETLGGKSKGQGGLQGMHVRACASLGMAGLLLR